jgi:hypothetical protein
VPNWVIDEALGRTPRDLVPFRAPATTTARPARVASHRGGTILRVVLAVAVIAGLIAAGRVVGVGPMAGNAGTTTSALRPDSPPAGHEEAGHPLGAPQPVVIPSKSYRFLALQDDDKTPIRWSACRPIHYVVRPANAPANGQRMIEDAFARVATVTGFTFVNDGPSDEAPRPDRRAYQKDRYGDRWAPVLVTWATHDEVPDFGVEFAGEASPFGVRSRSGDVVYVSGDVRLDPVKLGIIASRDGEAQARAIILHELGHLMGLAHVNDPNQVMAPRVRSGVTEYQPGDLAGLNQLGSGPCQPDV